MHNIIHRFPLLSPCRYTWIRFVYTGGIYGKIYVGRRSPGPVCPLVAILSSCLYLASLNFRPERWKKLPIVAQSTDIFPPFFFPRSSRLPFFFFYFFPSPPLLLSSPFCLHSLFETTREWLWLGNFVGIPRQCGMLMLAFTVFGGTLSRARIDICSAR